MSAAALQVAAAGLFFESVLPLASGRANCLRFEGVGGLRHDSYFELSGQN